MIPMPDHNPFLNNPWVDFMTRMMTAGTNAGGAAAADNPIDAARKFQAGVLRAWSEYADQYMRTPQFLEAMRNTVNASVEMRKQTDDFLARMQRSTGAAASRDVDDVLRSVHQMETRLLRRLDDLSDRLESVVDRLEDIESTGRHKSNGKTGRAPGGPTVRERARARAAAKRAVEADEADELDDAEEQED